MNLTVIANLTEVKELSSSVFIYIFFLYIQVTNTCFIFGSAKSRNAVNITV